MAASMNLSEAVIQLHPVASLNTNLARLTFAWQKMESSYLVGIVGFPLFEVDSEEKACWLCEQLNTGLWDAVDRVIDLNNIAMRECLASNETTQQYQD